MPTAIYSDGRFEHKPSGEKPFALASKLIDPSGHTWTIGGIVFTGERYYMLTDFRGVVSLMPAVEVETWRRV